MKKMTKSLLAELPSEIMLHIVDYMDKDSDAFRFSLLNKSIHELLFESHPHLLTIQIASNIKKLARINKTRMKSRHGFKMNTQHLYNKEMIGKASNNALKRMAQFPSRNSKKSKSDDLVEQLEYHTMLIEFLKSEGNDEEERSRHDVSAEKYFSIIERSVHEERLTMSASDIANKKAADWKAFLSIVTIERGMNVAQVLSKYVFEKVQYKTWLANNVPDAHPRFCDTNGTIQIGKVELRFSAHEDENGHDYYSLKIGSQPLLNLGNVDSANLSKLSEELDLKPSENKSKEENQAIDKVTPQLMVEAIMQLLSFYYYPVTPETIDFE